MKSKAAIVADNKQAFQITEIDVKEPRDDEVLIKVIATGMCHTDIAARDMAGLVTMPAVLGHEGAGIVLKAGKLVTGIKAGDRVIISYTFCQHCENCLTAHPAVCESFNDLNFVGRMADGTTPYQLNGQDLSIFFGQSSFSQYVVTKAINVIVVDVDSDDDLALLGPLGCGFQTGAGTVMNYLNPKAGESIVIFGAGAVGLTAVMGAKLAGCLNIIAVDIHPHRLELALKVGATHVINSREQDVVAEVKKITGKGAHYAVETTGVTPVVKLAVHAVKPLGVIAIVAITGEVTFDVHNDILIEGKSIIGVVEGDAVPHQFIPRLVSLYKRGLFPIQELIEFYPLEEINQALDDSLSGKVVKPILRMQ
ncbi:MAG: NAD(P)-dependent alcohol dehydrogenase [Enterobacteriaceae bacterium]